MHLIKSLLFVRKQHRFEKLQCLITIFQIYRKEWNVQYSKGCVLNNHAVSEDEYQPITK